MNEPVNSSLPRTILLTLVIGGSFYLGMLLYPYTMTLSNKEIHLVKIRKFAPGIEQSVKNDLIIDTGKNKITVKNTELQKWVVPFHRQYSGEDDKRLDTAPIAALLESLSPELNIEPVNAKLTFRDNKASIFVPSVTGKKLDVQTSLSLIYGAILDGRSSASLVFDTIEPDITLEKINDLGINTLIATGQSDYGRSPASRITNIRVGMARFNGTIVPPGEEFSFNEILGDVSEQAGYQAELVIKNGQLVREVGGGICQVSTTVFRAAIMAGLPILERKPHSFPVQYYNPQGFDSTIYPGVVDLRFRNDTPNHILIQTKIVGSKLSVEVFGSSDGRRIELDGPYQYDKKVNGAMKAYFIRKIFNGEQLAKEERFNSNYSPPPGNPLERNPLE